MMSKMGLSQQIMMAVALLMASIASSEAFAPSSVMFPGTRPSSLSSRQTTFSYTAATSPSIKTTRTSSSASLQMVASGVAVSAITGAITGGLFAGSLHAISGPDHLAALLPRCCGQRWYRAGRIGALWGMGHGVSATIIGVFAFGLKNRIKNVSRLQGMFGYASSAAELAVGLSLVVIGLLGIREAREWEAEIEGVQLQSLSAAAADAGIKTAPNRAVIFNGLLHGFSWDGAPSLAPALAVATWRGNIAFLMAYALGTMSAMAFTTTLIGEGTRQAGQVFNRPDIPQKLSLVSSVVAILIGIIWCGVALR